MLISRSMYTAKPAGWRRLEFVSLARRLQACEGQQRKHCYPMNVHRKPISEMSMVCCGTCQTTRGSRHSVGKLKVGSAIIEGFRLTLALRGYGPRSRFSEDITRNRMQVCWNFLLESGARKICAWKIVAIHYHYHFFPRLAWAKKTHFPSPARIMSLGGKHI